MRLFGFAAFLAVVVLAIPAASIAANHQTFADAVGDDSGGWAPDIVSADVTSTDDGAITFDININEQGGRFFYGDEIYVAIDSDQNPTTTYKDLGGIDTILILDTDNKQLNYSVCYAQTDGSETCTPWGDSASDTQTGANSHRLEFKLRTDWLAVNFWVEGYYKDPNDPNAQSFRDYGPDNGSFVFDLKDDADGDRVAGLSDKCPSFKAGPFSKGEGCPPSMPEPKFSFDRNGSFGGYLSLSRITMQNAPARTNVTARFAGFTLRRTGPGDLRGINGRRLRIGSLATFIYSRPNVFGSYTIARVTAKGFKGVRKGCTPPGSTKFMSCTAKQK
jgi:hypothetical protein